MKIIFCALCSTFLHFQETYVMPFSHLLLLTTIMFGKGGGISFLHFFNMKNKKKKKKKSSPIKLITANDLSLCQVFLILHKLKFVNLFKFFLCIVLIKFNLLTDLSYQHVALLKACFHIDV